MANIEKESQKSLLKRDQTNCPLRCAIDCRANLKGGECKAPFIEVKEKVRETSWHNVTDPEWEVVANVFKSYTIEGAVEQLKRGGYKISKNAEKMNNSTETAKQALQVIGSLERQVLELQKQVEPLLKEQDELREALKKTGALLHLNTHATDPSHLRRVIRDAYDITKSALSRSEGTNDK